MRVKLFLLPDGMESVAKGRDPYPWELLAVAGDLEGYGKDGVLIATVDAIPPSKDQLIAAAVVVLQAKKEELVRDHHEALVHLQEKIDNLLAIGYEERP